MNGVRTFSLNFDGSCWPNPGGKAGYGYVIHDGDVIHTDSGIIGTGPEFSNNYAEFFALHKALEKIYEILANESFPKTSIRVYGDSKLVINIMNRKWKVQTDKLYYPAKLEASLSQDSLFIKKVEIKYIWVPREKNTEADILSKEK
jgi:ribonuclease HI